MKKFLIPLSIAALTFAAIGAGAVQTPSYPTNDRENDVNIRGVADTRSVYPTNADENDRNWRQVADLKIEHDYPAPQGDGGSPDIRFPGRPSA